MQLDQASPPLAALESHQLVLLAGGGGPATMLTQPAGEGWRRLQVTNSPEGGFGHSYLLSWAQGHRQVDTCSFPGLFLAITGKRAFPPISRLPGAHVLMSEGQSV